MPSSIKFDDQVINFFENFVFVKGCCVQVMARPAQSGGHRRIVRSSNDWAFGGWFTDPYHLVAQLKRLEDVSAYCTFNPVRIDHRPAAGKHNLQFLRHGEGASDEDISCLRYLLIDIDPERDIHKNPSTAEELAACEALRDRIVADKGLAPHCLTGVSGNGGTILVRIDDLENTPENRDAAGAFVDSLRDYEGEKGAHVDSNSSIYSPSRMISIPGTMKCKGLYSTPDKPWRVSSLSSNAVTPFDLMAWADEHGVVRSDPIKKKSKRKHQKDAFHQASTWLFSGHTGVAIQGNDGDAFTFGIAFKLVHGFGLSQYDALELMRRWNQSCIPSWEDAKLASKVIAADEEPASRPRGWALHNRAVTEGLVFTDGRESPPASPPEAPAGLPPEPPDGPPAGDDFPDLPDKHGAPLDDPVKLARLFIDECSAVPGFPRYRWHAGHWWKWNDSHYQVVPDKEVKSTLLLFIDKKMDAFNIEQFKNQAPSDEKPPRYLKPSKNLLDLMEVALRGLVPLSSPGLESTFWIGQPAAPWAPSEIVPFSNRLMHIPSFIKNSKKAWIAKTPRLFNTYSLNYRFNYNSYDGPIDPPDVLKYYCETSLGGDEQVIRCVQQMLGYLMVPSNRYQKMFFIIGPPRAGKGLLLKMIQAVIGIENIVYPTFSSLATVPFGKQQLLGKAVAILGDARLSGRTDVATVVESILSITGDDPQTVSRKYNVDITQKLACRFVISSNMIPRLSEASGALLARAIIINLPSSFVGREDTGLDEKLLAHTQEIARWGIDGLVSLTESKGFAEPDSSVELRHKLLQLSSPVLHFADECLVRNVGSNQPIAEVYAAFKDWCRVEGKDFVPDRVGFERDLVSAVKGITLRGGTMYGASVIKSAAEILSSPPLHILGGSNGSNGHHAADEPSIHLD